MHPAPSLAERGMLMTTYEEVMIILTTGLLIAAILNLKNTYAALLFDGVGGLLS